MSQLPSADKFRVHYTFQDARIYSSRGDLLYNMADLSKNGGRRIVEPLQDRHDWGDPCRNSVNRIPIVLQNATIATEDATFYKNPGFDPWSIVRAAMQDVQYGHIVSGASTITQQLVRSNMLNDERSLTRKAQEVALAYEVSKRFSKRQILWYYLNAIPYGNLAIGAQAAAHVYFGIPVCRLDLAQAALLAGLPRAPTDYNPVRHRAAALTRMRSVLQLMWKHGYLAEWTQIGAAMAEAQQWRFWPPSAPMRYPSFVRYVIDQVKATPALRQQLYQGIDVYTTIDPRLQDLAQRIVSRQIDGLASQHVTDGALVSLDLHANHYGWIMAMVGSAHYRGAAGQINMAITPRQPGSSMKPFNYIWAFAHGNVNPGTIVQDTPVALPDPNNIREGGWYLPKNYDHLFHGPVTLRQALANSLNIPAVKVEYYITSPARVVKTAADYGMKSIYQDNPGLACSVCYAVTLGGLSKGTRLLEETSAYGVFASSGWTVPPVGIWKIVQRSTGKVIYCSADCPRGVHPDRTLTQMRRQVLDNAHAYEMTNVLSDNSARCTPQVCEFGLTSPLRLSRPAAAKTGTTTNFTDNWTIGYTPQLVTGVWVGNADRTPMWHVIGVTGASPIWHGYMEAASRLLHLPAVGFQPPPNVFRSANCRVSSNSYHLQSMDLVIGQPPLQGFASFQQIAALPLCALPEKGFLPVPCNRYPLSPGDPPPICPVQGRYTISNSFGLPQTPIYPSNPNTYQPVQPPSNQGSYLPPP